MKNALLVVGVIVLMAAAAGGGYFYGTSQASSSSIQAGSFDPSQFDPRNMTQEQLEQMREARGGGQRGQFGEAASAGIFAGGTMGEIVSIENGVVTIRTEDAQVKVKTTDTTLIEKLMSVNAEDLEVGEQVVVSGSQNDDGSTTARSIRVLTSMGK